MLGQEPAGALPREGPLIDTEFIALSRSTAKGSLRLPFAAWTLLTVALTAAAGCADVSGQALQQDVAQVRQDLNSLTLAVHRSRGDTETVVGQLDRRTREQRAARRALRGGRARLRPRRRAVPAGGDPRAPGSFGRRGADPPARALRRRPGAVGRGGPPAGPRRRQRGGKLPGGLPRLQQGALSARGVG